jgi:signal transduction histidine kinase
MTPHSDSMLPLTESTDLIAGKKHDGCLHTPGVDLVFTQDVTGQYLSFYWRDASDYHLDLSQVVGHRIGEAFSPVAIAPYLNRVRHVLEHLTPEKFNYPFRCTDQYLVFDLTISPVLLPHGTATSVIVTGRLLHTCSEDQALELINSLVHPIAVANPERYQKLLTQVAWNVRRTLDLQLIWQQTVSGLGEALAVSRCLLCSYQPLDSEIEVVAEHCQPDVESMLGAKLQLTEELHLGQALATLKPVFLTCTDQANQQNYSVLTVATCYKDQPNGLIILHQFDQNQALSEVEIRLVQELADQVGTDIAHATLFAESQTLAGELQEANARLLQKHRELEEARHQAEEASRLKSEFLANTSHELRTPLNGMIGFLKLIMDGMADDPAEQSEFIQEAYHSAVHLLSIINDILDIAKIEAGKMELDLNPVKLDDLLSDVENFTRTQAQQKNLSFEIRTPATRDEVILMGNYQRLLQVMLNLVGNAIKFTHQGGVTISAEVIHKKVVVQNQEKPGMVKISVADTGIGVSLEKQDKLFQSFSQLDGSRTRQYGGTGLGLAISQKLVEAMSGVVNFYSMGEGLGSTVTFTVPLYQDPVMTSAQPDNVADLLL